MPVASQLNSRLLGQKCKKNYRLCTSHNDI